MFLRYSYSLHNVFVFLELFWYAGQASATFTNLPDEKYISNLTDICEDLRYDKQYCHVDENEMECLRQKAVLHNEDTCAFYKPKTDDPYSNCIYVEVCTFTTDPQFICNKNYSCFLNETGHINCEGDGLPEFSSKCNYSLTHCPGNECHFAMNPAKQFRKVFRDNCLPSNKGQLTIYYIDRVHFNNITNDFGSISALQLAPGDENNKCAESDTTINVPSSTSWRYVVITLAVFFGLLLVVFGTWKFKNDQEQDNKMWETKIERAVNKLIADVEGAFEMESRSTRTEDPQPVPTEGSSLSYAGEGLQTVEPDDEINSGSDYDHLLQATSGECTNMISCENPTYSSSTAPDMYANSSVSTPPGSAWSKTDDVFVLDSDTESGYSGKFTMNGNSASPALPSSSNCIPMSKLDPITEADSVKDEDGNKTEVSKLMGDMKVDQTDSSTDHDHTNALFINPNEMDNPTYFYSTSKGSIH